MVAVDGKLIRRRKRAVSRAAAMALPGARMSSSASLTRGGAAYQSWNLDSQGNWSSSTTSGTTQTRTTDAQNQITSITGTAGTPTYDANGNMISDQNGNTLKYDAWNRLVSVTNSAGQIIAEYSYDARGYRVTESYPVGGNGVAAGTTNYIYYDSQWQAIEVRNNGTAASDVTSQTVWSAAYVNSPVLQDTYSGGTIQLNSRIYFLHDANWNTTAVVGYNATTQTWGVAQRYVYSPYGSILILNSDFSTPPSGTQPISNYLYQGMALDAVTGLYYARNRNYSPSLGVWISQDPLQYVNGANTYQMEMGGPVGAVDPRGTGWLSTLFPGGGTIIGGYSGIGGVRLPSVPPSSNSLLDSLGAGLINAGFYLENTLGFIASFGQITPLPYSVWTGQNGMSESIENSSSFISFRRTLIEAIRLKLDAWSKSVGHNSGMNSFSLSRVFVGSTSDVGGLAPYISPQSLVGQLTLGQYSGTASAIGNASQSKNGPGIYGTASFTVHYYIRDEWHLHTGLRLPGNFWNIVSWSETINLTLSDRCYSTQSPSWQQP
ncbi:MAG: RHS repeat-associated core domain-containing protein [Phycisphaerales bacterium]|nr:RHS repeat-associated core domain-containing protein [Phycisphaerales bacterium]